MRSLTERETNIYSFVSQYGSITIDQVAKIFLKNKKQKYVIASKILQKMVELNYLKVGKIKYSNANIYYINNKLSFHDLTVIQYCAELINIGAANMRFQPRMKWDNFDTDMISDGFLYFEINNKKYIQLLEVAFLHKEIRLADYEELYESGFIQQQYGKDNVISLVIITDIKLDYKSDIIPIKYIDFNFNNLVNLFM